MNAAAASLALLAVLGVAPAAAPDAHAARGGHPGPGPRDAAPAHRPGALRAARAGRPGAGPLGRRGETRAPSPRPRCGRRSARPASSIRRRPPWCSRPAPPRCPRPWPPRPASGAPPTWASGSWSGTTSPGRCCSPRSGAPSSIPSRARWSRGRAYGCSGRLLHLDGPRVWVSTPSGAAFEVPVEADGRRFSAVDPLRPGRDLAGRGRGSRASRPVGGGPPRGGLRRRSGARPRPEGSRLRPTRATPRPASGRRRTRCGPATGCRPFRAPPRSTSRPDATARPCSPPPRWPTAWRVAEISRTPGGSRHPLPVGRGRTWHGETARSTRTGPWWRARRTSPTCSHRRCN